MGFLEVSGVLVTLAAVLSFINHKVLRLPTTIGLMLLALLLSAGLTLSARLYPQFDDFARQVVASIDFNDTLMHGLLGFLLFAGALHVQLAHLRKQTWLILSLATVGVVLTTVLVGFGTWALMQALGQDLSLMYSMLFRRADRADRPDRGAGGHETGRRPPGHRDQAGGRKPFQRRRGRGGLSGPARLRGPGRARRGPRPGEHR